MLETKKWLVTTFFTTAAAMETEKRCHERGVEGKLIPVPRHITADCGLAWRGEPADRQILEVLLSDLEVEDYFEVEL